MNAEGNPDLDVELKPVKVGGIDHHVFLHEDPAIIQEQAEASKQLMGNKPFILAPNCAIPPTAEEATYIALKNSILKEKN